LNLHDPNRPTVNHRVCFTGTSIVVPKLEVWPMDSGEVVEVSCFLPVQGDHFASVRFHATVNLPKLPELLTEYRSDPEALLLKLFDVRPDSIRPALGQEPDERELLRSLRRTREISERAPPAPVEIEF
jgi:hypothetical protein